MEGSRLTRYIRIAVTALSLTACVVLIALWVRSYWWCDMLQGSFGYVGFGCDSYNGSCAIMLYRKTQAAWWFQRDVNAASIKNGDFFRLGYNQIFEDPYKVVPHGFVAVVALMFAAAPWIHWSKRFSLRTLLIATTLVAVGLGIVVVAM